MHVPAPSLLLVQLLEGAVGGVEGQQFGGAEAAERLAEPEQSGAQVQEEGVRGVHLEEDFRHLVGPDLGTAGVGVQAAPQPGEQPVPRVRRQLQQVLQDLEELVMELRHELQGGEGRASQRNKHTLVPTSVLGLPRDQRDQLELTSHLYEGFRNAQAAKYLTVLKLTQLFLSSCDLSAYLVNIGLLDLCLLWTGARGVKEVAVALHHSGGLEQAGDVQHCP